MKKFFYDWPNLAWFGLASAGAILVLAWLIQLPVFWEGPLQGRDDKGSLIPLLNGASARGTVSAQRNGLSKIKVKTATYMRRNTCRLEAVLLKEGRVIATADLRSSWFPDLGWVEIPFYKMGSNLAEGKYMVRFRSPDSDPGNAVALAGRAGEGVIMMYPVYCTDRIPVWSWLERFRPDYGKLLLAFTVFLACGGLAVGVGTTMRRGGRDKPPS